MSNKTADDLRNVKKSHGEAEQRAKETVEDAIEDLDFVSVYTLKHSNRQDSIAMQLEFSGLEDLISEQEPFEELDVGIQGTRLSLIPEDSEINPR